MLPPCHSYALTRRRFLPSKNRFAFICYTDFTLQCKTFVVVHMLNDENDLLSSTIFPDQRAPYSSLESRIASATSGLKLKPSIVRCRVIQRWRRRLLSSQAAPSGCNGSCRTLLINQLSITFSPVFHHL
uniref:Uncharacterized protein n=1 Tax=Ixodes ricinus TaxID=34613 RepID=A0A147BET1_IXORI